MPPPSTTQPPPRPARPARPLSYATPHDELPEPSLLLTLGSDIGVAALLTGAAAAWGVSAWGGQAVFLMIVPALSALIGLPLTLIGAFAGRCRNRARYLAVGLTCNGIVWFVALLAYLEM